MYRISMISIHALREEGDSPAGGGVCAQDNFYPRPPRGGRHTAPCILSSVFLFLSTPSARRATTGLEVVRQVYPFLSTPSARRATARGFAPRTKVCISIHALREEGDPRAR